RNGATPPATSPRRPRTSAELLNKRFFPALTGRPLLVRFRLEPKSVIDECTAEIGHPACAGAVPELHGHLRVLDERQHRPRQVRPLALDGYLRPAGDQAFVQRQPGEPVCHPLQVAVAETGPGLLPARFAAARPARRNLGCEYEVRRPGRRVE